MASVSRTAGESQIVEEIAISFTNTTAIDWLLPGVAPTGKPVEMAVAVVVGAVIERTCMSMSASSMYRSLSSPRSRSGRVYCVQPVRLVPRRKKSDTRCTSAVLRHLKRLCITNKLNGNYPLHSRTRRSVRNPRFVPKSTLRGLNLARGAAILTVTSTYDTIITLYPGRDVHRQACSNRRRAWSNCDRCRLRSKGRW